MHSQVHRWVHRSFTSPPDPERVRGGEGEVRVEVRREVPSEVEGRLGELAEASEQARNERAHL